MIWRHARHRSILIEGERQASASMVRGRLFVLSVCFMVAFSIIALRLVELAVIQGGMFNPSDGAKGQLQEEVAAITQRRGDVYDRHGFLVATTLKTPSLYVDPSLVLDAEDLFARLHAIIPDLNEENVLNVLRAKNRFGWVKRGITPEQQQAILGLGEPGLGFQYEYKRVYPQKGLFAHAVGYTDRDGLGLSGIERGQDDILSSGEDVNLSLDLRVQHLVKREVARAINEFDARAGAGIVMDAHTGEVLAAVSLPDFDLNLAKHAEDHQKFNRVTLGAYELGSVFKIFSTAAYLDLVDHRMSQTFDARKPMRIGRYTISDYHAQKRIMSLPDVFIHSSNIGSALMAQKIGGQAMKAFYDDLGLLSPLNVEVKEIGRPLSPNVWGETATLTTSYGHGISSTTLQTTAAVASIINGGTLVSPTFMKHRDNSFMRPQLRVVSEGTSARIRQLLRLAVSKGTGKNADVDGYMVGGKTGTAEKSIGGRYQRDRLISSFVGAFPMDDPRYVIMVMVDEPKGNDRSYGYATAGWVAAPAVQRIVKSMASILGLPADRYDPAKDVGNALLPYVYEKKKGAKHLASY